MGKRIVVPICLISAIVVAVAGSTEAQSFDELLPSAPVSRSGQTTCWDADGNPLPCAGTGQDGEFRKGVKWPVARFTDNLDGTVTDRLTGLVWLKDADCFAEQIWEGAFDRVDELNAGLVSCSEYTSGSRADWRLPTHRELFTLVDHDASDPALPDGHPFVNPQWRYWASSSYQDGPDMAYYLDLSQGYGEVTPKDVLAFVWPVRGGAPFASVSGSCPGPASIHLACLTPEAEMNLLWAAAEGVWIVPGGPCQGTEIDLQDPVLLSSWTADVTGDVTIEPSIPPAACGTYLQGLDSASCAVTNVTMVPGGATPSAPAQRTGQTLCFDSSGNEIPCAGSGQDGDIRPGVPWPAERFADHLDGTVSDRLTGLTWLKDGSCLGTLTWRRRVHRRRGLEHRHRLPLC